MKLGEEIGEMLSQDKAQSWSLKMEVLSYW